MYITVPDFGGDADDGEEHAIEVEVPEESLHPDPVDREGDLRHTEVQAHPN